MSNTGVYLLVVDGFLDFVDKMMEFYSCEVEVDDEY